MVHQPLFSTYRTGENRVTSSILAVFQRIDLSLVERLLGSAAEESTLGMITFTNQLVLADADTVPDAAISANFRYLFEVKTERNAIRRIQLEHHLKILDDSHADERLFVITPDAEVPVVVSSIDDDRLIWLSFATLHQAIEDLLADPAELVGERTAFLLRELQALFQAEGLVRHADVVVVAARWAYPEYQDIHAYICQANRSFASGLTHMGFYATGAIQPELPRILHREDQVVFSRGEADRRLARNEGYDQRMASIIRTCLDRETRTDGQSYQIFVLTPPHSVETERLTAPIVNTTTTAAGKRWAWTLGQRYVRLPSLLSSPATTTELDNLELA